MTAGDKVIVVAILMAALVLSALTSLGKNRITGSDPVEIIIEVDGKEQDRLFFSASKTGRQYQVQGPLGYSRLELGDNKIRMVESPCPDKICIGMGWISQPGESIICIPNRIVVRLISASNYGYDGLSQ